MLARYSLGEELGRGGGGAVYRSRDLRDGALVAVKLFRAEPGPAPASGALLPLSQALPAAAQLSHPDIAAVYACGESESGVYVVMECADGRDLRAHAQRGHLLPLDTVLEIAGRVADALAYVHAHGLVHGDVNPANIVFDAERSAVKLVDWVQDSAGRPGAALAYAAPEQVCGLPATPQSDQFSLAVTIYRLATGERPFSANSRPQLAYSIVNEQHVDVRARDPALPDELAALLDRALAKQPCLRYPLMSDFARAIRSVARSREP